jgi:diacylglycerol kinase (ATP)
LRVRVLVIRNARSGTSRRRSQVDKLVTRLESGGASVELASPASPADARATAAQARRAQHDVLLAAGGDGTLSVVVNGLVQTPKAERPALAILPVGRGNDFAAELGLNGLEQTLDALARDERRFVDLAKTEAGVFLGVGGTGFDAQAARRAQNTPLLSGRLVYGYAVLRTLLDFRHLEARVRYDGGVYEGPVTFAAVGNGRRYGGGMHITPEAKLEDGLLDLCLVRDISRAGLLFMFPTVFSGSHLGHWSVEYRKTKFVEIETEEPAEFFADGEFLQETPLRIDVLPGELEVVA